MTKKSQKQKGVDIERQDSKEKDTSIERQMRQLTMKKDRKN